MKKLLIGCAVVVLLAVVLLVGALIYIGVKVQKFQTNMVNAANGVAQLDTKYPFTPPVEADAAWDKARVDAYFDTRAAMYDLLHSNPEVQKLMEPKSDQKSDIGAGKMLRLLSTFPIQFLNEYRSKLESHHMAPAEYFYWTRTIYTTIKVAAEQDNADMATLYSDVQGGKEIVDKAIDEFNSGGVQVKINTSFAEVDPSRMEIPPVNIAIINEHKEELRRSPEFVFFELILATKMEEFKNAKSPSQPAPANP